MDAMEKHEVHDTQGACGCACGEKAEHAAEEKNCAKSRRRAYVPAVDIIEAEGAFELVVDVPGVDEGGVELSVEKNVLTLSATPADGVVAGKKLAYAEYGVGEYRRSFTLSDAVDQDAIAATLKNGVLRIRLPKAASISKKIAVNAS